MTLEANALTPRDEENGWKERQKEHLWDVHRMMGRAPPACSAGCDGAAGGISKSLSNLSTQLPLQVA